MKKKERVKLQRDIKKFANEFLTTVSNNIKLLNEFDKQESNLFPSIFFTMRLVLNVITQLIESTFSLFLTKFKRFFS